MGGQQRQSLGERISARLAQRSARRARVGTSPAFFARLGLLDPAPRTGTSADEPVYLSGAPFYEMMRRLAAARLQRQTRLTRYEKIASRRKMSAGRRLWSPSTRRSPYMFGPSVLSDSDLILPEPLSATPEEAPEEQRARPRVVDGWSGRVKSSGRSSAWRTRATLSPAQPTAPTPSVLAAPTPAADSTTTPAAPRPERPISRLGRRLSTNVSAQDPVIEAVTRSGRPVPPRLARVIESVSSLPVAEQVRIVRRAAQRMGGTARVIHEQLEQHSPDHQVTPVAVATNRMSPRRAQRRGLRPIMSRSPMMNAISPPPAPSAPIIEAPRQSPRVSRPRAPRTALRAAPPRADATSARRPRRSAPARRHPSSSRAASADAGADGPPAPSAYLAARATMLDAARVRSLLPVITPTPAASTPSTAGPLTGAVRAARRAASGRARPGSVLPRIVAPDTDVESSASPLARSPRRARSRLGQVRRSAATTGAPTQQVIAPTPLPTEASPDNTAPAPKPRSGWRPRTPSMQQAAQRASTGSTQRSLVPRPAPQASAATTSTVASSAPASASAPQRSGSARRALVRARSADPVGRSSLPRLTRRPTSTPTPPDTVGASGQAQQPTSRSGGVLRALVRAEAPAPDSRSLLPTMPRISGRRIESDGRASSLRAPGEVLPTSAVAAAAAAAAVDVPTPAPVPVPVPATISPLRAASQRSQIGTPSETSLLPRVRAASLRGEVSSPRRRALQQAQARDDVASPRSDSILPRAARAHPTGEQRRLMVSAPSAVTIEASPASTKAPGGEAGRPTESVAPRSAWGPSPGKTQIIAARGASGKQRSQARHLVQASRRDERSPLVGYSARRATGKRQQASVDVKLRRAAAGPVGYVAPRSVVFIQIPEEQQSPPSSEPVRASTRAPAPAPARAASPGRAPSILDVGAPVRRAPPPSPSPTQSRPASTVRRQAIDRPLDRIGARAEVSTAGSERPSRRSAWGEGRQLPGERPAQRPRLQIGPDGVLVQAPAGAEAEAVEAEETRATRARGMSGVGERDVGLPAPWSRPVWGRERQPQPSSRLRQSSLSRAGRASSGVYMSQRLLGGGRPRTASPVRDFAYPEAPGDRPPLPWTLEAVDAGSSNEGLPGWAQRASGRSRITGSDDFLRRLAQAGEVSEVVRVIFERSGDSAPAMRHMSSPVLQVIEQIRAEAHRASAPEAVSQPTVTATASGGGPRKAMRRGGPQPQMQQLARGMTGLRAVASAPSSEGVGEDKVSRLARRLRDLIHLAEVKNRRDDARQGVRMAEDSASARSEGQSSPTQSTGGDNMEQVDIDALTRQVQEQVQREQDLQRERRIDGGDSGDFWW